MVGGGIGLRSRPETHVDSALIGRRQEEVSMHRAIAWAGFLLLIFLHLDFWRPQSPELYFGWLPQELAYRLAWMVLAWLYLMYFTRFVWGREGT